MTVDELLNPIFAQLDSSDMTGLLEAKLTLEAAAEQFEGHDQERIDQAIAWVILLMDDLTDLDPSSTDQEEDDGIPTLDVNTGLWTNADKLEG
jgi:hypothetical protein